MYIVSTRLAMNGSLDHGIKFSDICYHTGKDILSSQKAVQVLVRNPSRREAQILPFDVECEVEKGAIEAAKLVEILHRE